MATFSRIVEARSLSAAARRLSLSLPAVSRQLSALEGELGASLLVRTTRKLTLTEAGRRYYEHCLRILREVEEAEASVRSAEDVRGVVVVSAAVAVGLARLGRMIPGLLAKHPALRVDLRLEDRVVDLLGDGVDVALRAGTAPPDSASIVAQRIGAWRRVVVASPKYLRARGVPKVPASLAKHEVLAHLAATGPAQRWRFMRDGEEHAVDVDGRFRANALSALLEAAVAGLGIALLPDWLVREHVARGDLRVLLDGYESPNTEMFAIHRVELRGVARVRAFVTHVRAHWES